MRCDFEDGAVWGEGLSIGGLLSPEILGTHSPRITHHRPSEFTLALFSASIRRMCADELQWGVPGFPDPGDTLMAPPMWMLPHGDSGFVPVDCFPRVSCRPRSEEVFLEVPPLRAPPP